MAQQRKVNWFAIWISVGVVVALVVVAFFVILANNQSTAPGEAPQASNINAETGAIHAGGDGDDVLATYLDFMCPACNQFEQRYGETISGLVDDGAITLDIHPVSILDRFSQGTEYSTRSANAMYCVAVADEAASVPFMEAMYANQPEEGSTGLTDEQILSIAADVGVTGIDSCVNDGKYAKFVAAMTEKSGIQGTPTVRLNGEDIQLTGDPQKDIVDALQ